MLRSTLVYRSCRFRRARAAAIRALQIDDTVREAHAALAYVYHYDWEWAEAGREFSRAIALYPTYALAQVWRANYLTSLNRLDEALVQRVGLDKAPAAAAPAAAAR
jgi:Tfp pilus assembly protein PilF